MGCALPENVRERYGIVPTTATAHRQHDLGLAGETRLPRQAVPRPANALNQLATQGTSRRGHGATEKLLLVGAGVRVDAIDPPSARIGELFEEQERIDTKMAALRQRGINADKPTAEYTKLNARRGAIDREIGALSRQRGDAIPLRKNATGTAALTPEQEIDRYLQVSRGELDALRREAHKARAPSISPGELRALRQEQGR